MKITSLLSALLLSAFCYAQSVLTDRNRFGISASAGIILARTNSDFLIAENNRNSLTSFGGVYEYQYSDLMSFRAGLNLETCKSFTSDKVSDSIDLYEFTSIPNSFNRSPLNYDDMVKHDAEFTGTPSELRQFHSRRNRFRYFTFPVEAVFRTRMKNFTRFYAKGGIKPQLCVSRRAFERSSYPFYSDGSDRYDKVILKDVRVWNATMLFGVGAERVISAKTSVYFDLEFNLALFDTFVQSQQGATLYVGKNGQAPADASEVQGSQDFTSNSLIQNQIQLKIGVFF